MTTQRNETTSHSHTAVEPDGLIGVFRTLAEQHDEAAVLFAQIKATPEARAMLWPQLRRALASHEHGEVQELYPVLREHEATRGLAEHHDEEARELDVMIAQLDTLEYQTAEWAAQFDALAKTVTHHAKTEEERRIFPLAQQTIGEARAVELNAKILAAKQEQTIQGA